jgi:hypothetical protein
MCLAAFRFVGRGFSRDISREKPFYLAAAGGRAGLKTVAAIWDWQLLRPFGLRNSLRLEPGAVSSGGSSPG